MAAVSTLAGTASTMGGAPPPSSSVVMVVVLLRLEPPSPPPSLSVVMVVVLLRLEEERSPLLGVVAAFGAVALEEEEAAEAVAARVSRGWAAYLACILKGTSWSCPSKLHRTERGRFRQYHNSFPFPHQSRTIDFTHSPAAAPVFLLQGPDVHVEEPADPHHAAELPKGLHAVYLCVRFMRFVCACVGGWSRRFFGACAHACVCPCAWRQTHRCASVERWCSTAMQSAASKALSLKGT